MDSKTIRAMSCKMMLIAASVAAPWMVAYGEALDNVRPLESSQSAEESETAPTTNDEAVPLALFHLDWLGTGNCLDSNASGQVYTNACQSNNNFQTWITRAADIGGLVRFKNLATQLCLQLSTTAMWSREIATVRTAVTSGSRNPDRVRSTLVAVDARDIE
jgi:hypothetical protein